MGRSNSLELGITEFRLIRCDSPRTGDDELLLIAPSSTLRLSLRDDEVLSLVLPLPLALDTWLAVRRTSLSLRGTSSGVVPLGLKLRILFSYASIERYGNSTVSLVKATEGENVNYVICVICVNLGNECKSGPNSCLLTFHSDVEQMT